MPYQDPRDREWEDRAERAYTDFTDRPGRTTAKWLVAVLAVAIVLAVVGGIIGFVGDWGGEAKRVASPDNVREQNTAVIENWEGMQAAAVNACNAKDSAQDKNDPTLVEDPALAYKATYRRQRADYNRRMANLYEAQAVRNLPLPSNLRSYPKVAPSLEEMQRDVC